MSKKISIIIPFKNEREGQLAIVLSSINNQVGIDFSQIDVHLVNDGGKSVDISRFSVLENLDLHYYEIENGGPGNARQYGIDHSESEYIMFMDADDLLHFDGVILEFFNTLIDSGNHDVIIAKYLEQFTNDQQEVRYRTHDGNWFAVYAKLFRRAHLENYQLRFHPELSIFEDTYFVGLACALTADIHYIDTVVYTWLDNPNSLARKENKSFDRQLHTLAFENRLYFEFMQKYRPDKIQDDLENYVAEMYMNLTKFGAEDEAAFWVEHRKVLTEFKDYWRGYSPALQERVNHKRDDKNSKFYGQDTSKFKMFASRFQRREKKE